MIYIDLIDWEQRVLKIAIKYLDKKITGVYGVPRGGTLVAIQLSSLLNIPLLESPKYGCLIVDDIIDSGKTKQEYNGFLFEALIDKNKDIFYNENNEEDNWVVFWYEETEKDDKDLVLRIAQRLGVDLNENL